MIAIAIAESVYATNRDIGVRLFDHINRLIRNQWSHKAALIVNIIVNPFFSGLNVQHKIMKRVKTILRFRFTTWHKRHLFQHILQLSETGFQTRSVPPHLLVCSMSQRFQNFRSGVRVQGRPLAEGEGGRDVGRVVQGKVDHEGHTMEELIENIFCYKFITWKRNAVN